jgi:hypothetical protein
MNMWIYVVYRAREEYISQDYGDDGTTYEMLTPVAGYEKKADALEHAVRANKQRLINHAVNEWDPFMDPLNPAYFPYRVAAVPLCVPSSVDTARKEMADTIAVLRDLALETRDEALALGLPAPPVAYPLWVTSEDSKSGVAHFFTGKAKLTRRFFNTSATSLCGVYLSKSSYNILNAAAGTRQCRKCLSLLALEQSKCAK